MFFKNLDKSIFFATFAILAIGIVALYSATSEYYSQGAVLKQVLWILIGLVFMLFGAIVDYRRFITLSYFLYGINMLFLILVLFMGEARGGAHRWIDLGAFNLQPSELVKVTLVLALSHYLADRQRNPEKLSYTIGALLLLLPAFFLIIIEPDLGGAVILVPVTFAILFVSGARIRDLMGISLLGLLSMPFLWGFLKDYQKQRLFVFINPDIDPLGSGYTVIQSKIAVGSGGLFGKGWLSGTQNQLNFLPERHTDFIFSVVGEEWGFAGAALLTLLYLLIVYRAFKIMETTPDMRAKLLATGIVTFFSFQAIVNIGMTMGFLPIVGLTLPLVSYGGSSMIITLFSLGLLFNIGKERPLF